MYPDFLRDMKEGSGGGISFINLIWASFGAQILLGDESGSNLELL
jgi:hypothetical protein